MPKCISYALKINKDEIKKGLGVLQQLCMYFVRKKCCIFLNMFNTLCILLHDHHLQISCKSHCSVRYYINNTVEYNFFLSLSLSVFFFIGKQLCSECDTFSISFKKNTTVRSNDFLQGQSPSKPFDVKHLKWGQELPPCFNYQENLFHSTCFPPGIDLLGPNLQPF